MILFSSVSDWHYDFGQPLVYVDNLSVQKNSTSVYSYCFSFFFWIESWSHSKRKFLKILDLLKMYTHMLHPVSPQAHPEVSIIFQNENSGLCYFSNKVWDDSIAQSVCFGHYNHLQHTHTHNCKCLV